MAVGRREFAGQVREGYELSGRGPEARPIGVLEKGIKNTRTHTLGVVGPGKWFYFPETDFRRKGSFLLRFYFHHQVIFPDLVACRHVEFGHDTVDRGYDAVLHLHRFVDHQ